MQNRKRRKCNSFFRKKNKKQSEKEWKHKQISPRKFDRTIPLMEISAVRYKNPSYSAIAKQLRKPEDKEVFRELGMY